MKKDLIELLNQVNSWLKYAETKNGVLIGFLSAGLWTSFSLDELTLESLHTLIVMIRLVSLCSLLFLISSFIPIIDRLFKRRRKDIDLEEINPYYFGDIYKINEEDLLQIFRKINQIPDDHNRSESEMHIANQIINNSQLAYSKFKGFNNALYIELIGTIVSFIIWVFLLR